MTGSRGNAVERTPAAVVGQLRDHYERLDGYSKRQRGLIETGRVDDLLGVLRERQDVIEAIERLSKQVTKVFADGLPEAERERIRGELDAIDVLARSIAERDRADQGELETKRSSVAEELGGVGVKRAAVRAYGGGGAGKGPRFQDGKA